MSRIVRAFRKSSHSPARIHAYTAGAADVSAEGSRQKAENADLIHERSFHMQGQRDLKVYQLAYKLAMEVFHLSKHFPERDNIL